jgi:DNA mismatch repair protein MutS
MVFPLKDVKPINERLDVVEYYFREPEFRDTIEEQLHMIGDLERIISKVAAGRVSPRELVQLKIALQAVEPIKMACEGASNAVLREIGARLDCCAEIRDRIACEIVPEPPLLLNKGGVVADGVREALDELRAISYNGKDYLLQIQQRESERTAIPSLKIAFNNVFGYYIEVRNTYKDNVPAEWIRKQTLVNAERYITQELKEYEEKILGAEEKIMALETEIFNNLVCDLAAYIPAIQADAMQLARLDVLLSFAEVSRACKYIRPVVSEENILDIKKGRHPVIERQLPVGEEYIPNDLFLDTEKQLLNPNERRNAVDRRILGRCRFFLPLLQGQPVQQHQHLGQIAQGADFLIGFLGAAFGNQLFQQKDQKLPVRSLRPQQVHMVRIVRIKTGRK